MRQRQKEKCIACLKFDVVHKGAFTLHNDEVESVKVGEEDTVGVCTRPTTSTDVRSVIQPGTIHCVNNESEHEWVRQYTALIETESGSKQGFG